MPSVIPPSMASAERALLGDSNSMQRVRDLIAQVAASGATVLIRGETGTGKELVARAIHGSSDRSRAPLVRVHCAALPETLLESELFGYERGAFTGASTRKLGKIELAQSGTFFLDEVGEIPMGVQAKLLRLLQEREYERLGSNEVRQSDARFIAATHRNLEAMIEAGQFREDLHYRLKVVTLWLPPLRSRRDDIPVLATAFCQRFSRHFGRAMGLSSATLRLLRSKRWPGNVRQLENFVERLVTLTPGSSIEVADVMRAEAGEVEEFRTETDQSSEAPPREGRSEPRDQADRPAGASPQANAGCADVAPKSLRLDDQLRAAERQALVQALEQSHGNRTAAARELGISRATLYNKLAEHGLV